jgi:hypothetical protein
MPAGWCADCKFDNSYRTLIPTSRFSIVVKDQQAMNVCLQEGNQHERRAAVARGISHFPKPAVEFNAAMTGSYIKNFSATYARLQSHELNNKE